MSASTNALSTILTARNARAYLANYSFKLGKYFVRGRGASSKANQLSEEQLNLDGRYQCISLAAMQRAR